MLFDDDADGGIDKAELGNVLRSFGQTPTEQEIADLMNELDDDGTNVLEFEEFVRLMHKTKKIKAMVRRKLTAEQVNILKEQYLAFDHDGSGAIDRSELGDVMKSLGQSRTDEELESLLQEMDTDGTKMLEFSEFVDLLESAGAIDRVIKKK